MRKNPLNNDIKLLFISHSTPEEWESKGYDFYQRKQYNNAKLCYEKSYNNYYIDLCNAYILYTEADNENNQPTHPNTSRNSHNSHNNSQNNSQNNHLNKYELAANIFEKLNEYEIAANCYEKSKIFDNYYKAAECYKLINNYNNAIKCYIKHKSYEIVIQLYYDLHKFDEMIQCCVKYHKYMKCIELIKTYESIDNSNIITLNEKLIKINEIAFKGAQFEHKNKNEVLLLQFIDYFLTINDKRNLLKRYKYYYLLLNIELKANNYNEIAIIYANQFDYINAAKYYALNKNYSMIFRPPAH